jgi:hypothetical protein
MIPVRPSKPKELATPSVKLFVVVVIFQSAMKISNILPLCFPTAMKPPVTRTLGTVGQK